MAAHDRSLSQGIALRTSDLAQQAKIRDLEIADHTRGQSSSTARGTGGGRKMALKRATRANPAAETTTTTTVTNEQLRALINQGVADALAARDADRSMYGDDSHNSGTGVRRTKCVAQECTYQDFMKCQPLFFKCTEGVVELTQWFERMETVYRISNCTMEN
ncbi:hypothetical protein Tco_0569261 [Tanacetum coccineum]